MAVTGKKSMIHSLDAWLWRRGLDHPAVRVMVRNEILIAAAVLLAGVLTFTVLPWIFWFGVGLAIMAWTFWGLARFFLRRGLGDYSTAFLRIVIIRWLGRLVLVGGILYISLIVYQAPVFALVGGMLAGALWGCIPGLVKAYLNINEVLACIMTNWIAANLVTWLFDKGSLFESLQNHVENTKTAYIYKTSFNGVETAKLGLDKLFPNSQVNGGILIAIGIAILIYILMNKTTLGYELKACGANRHAARYAGIADKRNIVLSMAIAGALSGAAASLYYLSGNTEFFWSTYQTLPATGFNGIPVALLAVSNPIGVIFTGCFMSMLDIVGLQLTNLTAYNEYITDVIIAIIVYLSAFSLVIKMFISGQRKRRSKAALPAAEAAAKPPEGGGGAEVEKGGESA